MRRTVIVALAVVLSVGYPVVGSGSEKWTYRACQPFDLENGIALSEVTYVDFGGIESFAPMTCWPNRTYDPSSRTVSQMNAAFTAGLTVTMRPGDWRWDSDTLRCDLDTSQMHGFRPATGDRDSTLVVAATIECLKANVGQLSTVNYLDLQVKGQAVYHRFGGIFPLAGYRCGPRVRQF